MLCLDFYLIVIRAEVLIFENTICKIHVRETSELRTGTIFITLNRALDSERSPTKKLGTLGLMQEHFYVPIPNLCYIFL